MIPNNKNIPAGATQQPGYQSPLNQYTRQPQEDNKDSPFYRSAAPSISLPKGGGALKGIDEKFSVNAVNGTAGMEIPLPLTPGRGGFTPALSLSYNSGSGNSAFGLGWGLSLPAIQRKTDKKLPLYDDRNESDTFLLAGAEDLIPELDNNGNRVIITAGDYTVRPYRPRIEGLFARIEHITKTGSAGSWWRVTTRDNTTTWYGLTGEGRITDPGSEQHIYKWLPQLVTDHKGNVQQYQYAKEDTKNITGALFEKNRLNGTAAFINTYLKSIRYCNKTPWATDTRNCYDPSAALPLSADFLMEAVLDYGDHSTPYNPLPDQDWAGRSDAFSDYHAGFEIRTYRKCQRVMMFHYFGELDGHHLVRSLELTYQHNNSTEALTEADFITAATQRGYEHRNGTWRSDTLPAMTFDYEPLQWNTSVTPVDKADFQGAPQGLTGPYQWTDFEGEGLPGILTEQGTGWFYKSNLGDGHFTPPAVIAEKPNFQGLGKALQWQDLDADGRRQIVTDSPVKGFWELSDDQQWDNFRTFPKNLHIDRSSPFTKMLDLDGDGRPDLLFTEDHAWTWYRNEGKQGFDTGGAAPVFRSEEEGPVLLLRDNVQSIFLADMSGDGMTDLVRITNGEVCYWPNTGYGRFGAKVSMANAPEFHYSDQYNPAYLILADISGTGAADLIYMGRHNTCTAWLNLSGNGFSAAQQISVLPGTDLQSKISVLDFLGNGTGCIVWSSPLPQHSYAPLQYIDLMGGKKPYLMRSYSNGMGKTVSVTYKSSTQFYLADKLAGTPWVTKLPFPVHCIERMTTCDAVSDTTYTQTYKYRHGYYDHEEREFRGFGYVETRDIDAALLTAPDPLDPTQNTQLDQKPVLTRTWYHTGAWLREQSLLDAFKKEYYRFEGWDDVTLIADIPLHLNPQQQREAYRALKGSPLRQEVYAQDGTAQEPVPYTVTASAYTVKQVQPQGPNRYASFINQPLQSVTFSCERNPDDPRVTQQLTLETDQYGNVLQSLAIAYPRKHAATSLPDTVQEEQAKMHITRTQNTFTNDVINALHYRLRLPAATRTYEVLGLPAPSGLWTAQSWDSAFTGVTEIDFSASASGAREQRLLSHTRSLYKDNNAADQPLGLYELQSLALPHEQYQLAFTSVLLAHADNHLITTAMLEEGGYVPMDGNYWLPSGTAGYADTAFANASAQFYTPVSFIDPWGNKTTVSYWGDYWLLPQTVTDAKQNSSTIESYDWRILQPTGMIDANENRSVICYDVLGMPVATAIMGKGNEADYPETLAVTTPATPLIPGLPMDGSADTAAQTAFWDPAATAAQTEAAAKALLGKATWRCIYNLHRQPTAVAMIAREEHYTQNPDSAVIIRVSYSDGLGRIAMHKTPATDGPLTNGGPVTTRWTGSGKTVYNNKGKAVMQFEPYYSASHRYDPTEAALAAGVSSLIFYDPLDRPYRIEMPDGTYSFTRWDNWSQTVYDANDTTRLTLMVNGVPTVVESDWYRAHAGSALTEERDAAVKALTHANTPSVLYTDTLGRPFYTLQNDGIYPLIHSYEVLDITGNRLAVVDGNGNTPLQYRYNLLKAPWWQHSSDGGTGQMLTDVAGQPLYHRDADDRIFRVVYDELRRPVAQWVNDGTSRMSGKTVYADGPAADAAKNLRGKVLESYDGGGKHYVTAYDFKGLPVIAYTQLISDAVVTEPDWTNTTTAPALISTAYQTTAVIDALGRPVTTTDAGGYRTRNTYDKAGQLKAVQLKKGADAAETYVQDIHYDVKGQREAIWYGNGSKTVYTYDPNNYRLTRIATRRLVAAPAAWEDVQDLYYFYDAVGNITLIRDDARPVLFYRNSIIEPVKKYTYDALYRLILAEGGEQISNNSYGAGDNYADTSSIVAAGSNPHAVRNYKQTYAYDNVGNILSLSHDAGDGSYTRTFDYRSGTSRLTGTSVVSTATTPYSYSYDKRGNMLTMPHLSAMDWNSQNQLSHITAGTTDAYYQYSGGQRIRKMTLNGIVKEERIYLGSFELYRKYVSGVLTLERTTVHISDDTGRIAMLEVKTEDREGDESPALLKRFIYSNHLQSSSFELDGDGKIISYEEYHPYGTTSYQAKDSTVKAAAKRYRFTGKERDEESGLNYHGARYYAPWLCRWTAVDPLESKYTGWSSYNYCTCNPINHTDSKGMENDDKSVGVKPMPQESWQLDGTEMHKVYGLSEVKITSQKTEMGAFIKTNWYDSDNKMTGANILYNTHIPKLNGGAYYAIFNYADKNGFVEFQRTTIEFASELDFSHSSLGYNNSSKSSYTVDLDVGHPIANLPYSNSLAIDWAFGIGSENTIITGGKMLNDVKNLGSIQELKKEGYKQFLEDGKLTPGETFSSSHKMLKSKEGLEIWVKSLLYRLVVSKPVLTEDPITSTQHYLGSYNFSMRVLEDGKTIIFGVADSKSIESATDHQSKGNSINRKDNQQTPFSTTYQRYIWLGE